jgi:SAM-dependent methyltransferase
MTLACPAGFDGEELHRHVVSMYERVAACPGDAFHFHVGVDYAVDRLGYDRAELEALPAECTARFAGVGNPFTAGPIPAGAVVVDHACGAGTDLLIAARRAGSGGHAIGIDITPAMRAAAQRAVVAAGLAERAEILPGSFDALPLADASADVVLSNGVLNLAQDKLEVLREAHRVLRPGGALLLADVVLDRRLAPVARADPQLWAACVGGALTEPDLLQALRLAGFVGMNITGRWACYRGTSVERKFGSSLRIEALAVGARKAR